MKKFFAGFIVFLAVCAALFGFDRGTAAFSYEEVTGTILNLAVGVEFADTSEDERITADTESDFDMVFNSHEDGLKSFIFKNSDGKLTAETVYLGTVKIDVKSSRYYPRYSLNERGYEEINESGYDNRLFSEDGNADPNGTKRSIEYVGREQELVAKVAKGLSELIALPKNADGDRDGYIDSLTIIPCKTVESRDQEAEWGNIFWPHMSNYYYGSKENLISSYRDDGNDYSFAKTEICGLYPLNYLISPYTYLRDGNSYKTEIICHEFMHILGAPDYYAYDGGDEYVGVFDCMGRSVSSSQLSLSYLRQKMGWIEEGKDVLAVEESGRYSLLPTETGATVKAYKIVLSDYFTSGDCYYIENRHIGGETGLIIYRVNEKNGFLKADGTFGNSELGNMYGKPEVYVFRRWENRAIFGDDYAPKKEITVGTLNYAYLYPEIKASYGGAGKRNIITDSNGVNTGISVSIKTYDKITGEIGFDVSLPEAPTGDVEGGAKVELTEDLKGRKVVAFENSYRKGNAYILVTHKNINNLSAKDLLGGKFGETAVVPISFQRYVLPQREGKTYVYVCFSDGEKISAVSKIEYTVDAPYYFGLRSILIGAGIGLGVFLITAAVIAAVVIKRKSRKDNGREQQGR